jgi:2,4-dienoyl-CoA reductase-like NADH-dependent reductase (Old Yellow Enzyme family)
MGALTRNRCIDNCKPTEASVKHYADRARDCTGLIVSEGIFVYLTGTDWVHAPVLFETEHAEAWKKVTDAVHMEGGKIYCQTWHAGNCVVCLCSTGLKMLTVYLGRAQHDQMPMLKNNGYPVLVPSKIPASGGKYRELPGNPVRVSMVLP